MASRSLQLDRRLKIAAYAAATWAFVFAVLSFYWAAGGSVGTGTIAQDLDALGWAGEPWVLALTGVAKVIAGLVALALVHPWGRAVPRRLLGGLVYGGGLTTVIYGAVNFVDHLLMVTGVRGTPSDLGSTAARWHLFFWDPYWMLGGVLFAAAAYSFLRATGEPATARARERRNAETFG